jgi:hypothetical protein
MELPLGPRLEHHLNDPHLLISCLFWSLKEMSLLLLLLQLHSLSDPEASEPLDRIQGQRHQQLQKRYYRFATVESP